MANKRIVYSLISGGIILALGGFAAAYFLTQPTWEVENYSSLTSRIKNGLAMRDSDQIQAYQILDGVLSETATHTISDPYLQDQIQEAKKVVDELHPKVAKQLEQQEQERLAKEAEAKKQAEAKARIIAENERAKKQAEEKAQAERAMEEYQSSQRKKRVMEYSNFPKEINAPLAALLRVEARVEVGMNQSQYSEIVGQTWGDVKIFIESPDAKKWNEYAFLVEHAIDKYKDGLDAWQEKIKDISEFGAESKFTKADEDRMQKDWEKASKTIKLIQRILDPEQSDKALKEFDDTHIQMIGD